MLQTVTQELWLGRHFGTTQETGNGHGIWTLSSLQVRFNENNGA